jgi:hypothetical protein
MIKGLFNIRNIIKASTILVLSLMLNIVTYSLSYSGGNFDTSRGGDPRVDNMGNPIYTYHATNYAVSSAIGSEAGKEYAEKEIIKEYEAVTGTEYVAPVSGGGCNVSGYAAQYQSGCWSCLVMEKLTSAFLNAAKHGLPVTQKAGITILFVGTLLWLVKWGLNNVSSFNEIQMANILGELFKFLFKALFALCFILVSTAAIRDYFVRPIMSVGAVIVQNMWDNEKVKGIEV